MIQETYTQEDIQKVLIPLEQKGVKWAFSKIYNTPLSPPLGWFVKKEPTQAASVIRFLLQENNKLKEELLEIRSNTKVLNE